MSDTPSAAADHTSLTLLGLARDQDPEAWRRLVTLYGPVVHHWTRRQGLSDNDAADIVQEVWTSVSLNLTKFRKDANQGTFRGWLWTITRNKVRDWFRQRVDSVAAAGGTDAQQAIQQIPDAEPADASNDASAALVQRALSLIRNDFEDTTWKAFWGLAVLGHAAKDVASELGLAANAVHQARFRVLKRLRSELVSLGVADDPSFVAALPGI